MRKYYGDNKLKRKDVRTEKLVDFEGIAQHNNANIMLNQRRIEGRMQDLYGSTNSLKKRLLGDAIGMDISAQKTVQKTREEI